MRERIGLVAIALAAGVAAACSGGAGGQRSASPTPSPAPAPTSSAPSGVSTPAAASTVPAGSIVPDTISTTDATGTTAPTAIPAIRLADVPEHPERVGASRASLSPEPTTTTAHVHRLVTAGDQLIAVGSTETYGVGSWPAIWLLDGAGDSWAAVARSPFAVAGTTQENGSAIDAVAMPDGTLMVLGWLSDRTGTATVLWRFRADGTPGSEIRRFDAFEMAGTPDRLVLDESGRPWVIARGRGVDGGVDVATEVAGQWQAERLGDGMAFDLQVAPTATGVEVFASRVVFGPDGTVVHAALDRWETRVEAPEIVTTEEELPAELGVTDLERRDGTTHLLVTPPTGPIELWSRATTTEPWASTPVPTHPSEAPMAITFADGDPVVLLLGPEGPDDRSEGRAVRVRNGVAEPWSGTFSIDFQTGPETQDYPATTWLGRPVLVDRRAADEVTAIVLDDGGAQTHPTGIPRMFPDRYDRIDALRTTPQGLVALVSTVNAGAAGQYYLGEGFVALLREQRWDGIVNGQLELAATWRGEPLFVSSSDTGMDQYVLGDASIDLLSTLGSPGRVSDIAVYDDTAVVATESGGLVRPFFGPVGSPDSNVVTEIVGLSDGANVLDVCDGTPTPTFVVEYPSGERAVAVATTPGPGRPFAIEDDAIVALQTFRPGPARPFCFQAADGTLRVLQDATVIRERTTALVTVFDEDLREISFGAPPDLPLDVQMFVSVTASGSELLAGRVSDRWGSWDAAVLRWTADGVEVAAIFAGNGRQEARSIVRVDDGWLVGGTDNGEAVAWKLPDG